MKTMRPNFQANPSRYIFRSSYRIQFIAMLIMILVALAASCADRPVIESDSQESLMTVTSEAASDLTPIPPTQPPEPTSPVIVLAADEVRVESDFLQSLSMALEDQGMELLIIPEGESSGLPEAVIYIIASTAQSASDFQQLNPDLPIIVLDTSGDNDSSLPGVRFSDIYYRKAAFAAGYLAAIITSEYRIGYIDLVGQEISEGFTSFSNGVTYYCGLCSPQYPPFLPYPVNVQLSSPYTSEKINAVVESLQTNKITTVYIHPLLDSSELVQSLDNAGIVTISTDSLINHSNWQTTIALSPDYSDTAAQLVTSLFSNDGLGELSPAVIVSAGHNVIGEGKMKHLVGILEELERGLIIPVE